MTSWQQGRVRVRVAPCPSFPVDPAYLRNIKSEYNNRGYLVQKVLTPTPTISILEQKKRPKKCARELI